MKLKILRKFDLLFFVIILILILFIVMSARAQGKQEMTDNQNVIAAGGTFALDKAVVAGGGSQTAQQQFNLGATTGQTIAGHRSTGANFSIYSGFWTSENFVPTAATATVGGRVRNAVGKGIRNVRITITFPSGEQQTVVSGASGYYRFADVPTGATYVFNAVAKRFTFAAPTQIRNITDDTQDIDFIADPIIAPPDKTAAQ